MNVEARLTERIGSAGARLHTARSRNDQVALDMHMYMKREVAEIAELLLKFEEALLTVAKKHEKTLMPGYTHLPFYGCGGAELRHSLSEQHGRSKRP